MKSLTSVTIFAACLLAFSASAGAQDCGGWSNWDLRGTYAMSGSGWIDLSKLVPSLPSGAIPMTWTGVHAYDGRGGGTGWVALNAGGVQMSIQLVGLTYAVQADCSMVATYSMKVKEFGATIGPVSRIYVIGARQPALELYGIQTGAGPGMPVDLTTSRRISMPQ